MESSAFGSTLSASSPDRLVKPVARSCSVTGSKTGFFTFIVKVSSWTTSPRASDATSCITYVDGLLAASRNGHAPSMSPVFASTVQPSVCPVKLNTMSSKVPFVTVVLASLSTGPKTLYECSSPAKYQYSELSLFGST